MPSSSSFELGGSAWFSKLGAVLGEVFAPGALNARVSFRNTESALIPCSVPRIVGRNMSLDILMSAARFPSNSLQSWRICSRVCTCSPQGHSCSSFK